METGRVRFDDMLATVLARQAETPAGRVAQWRQLLDLLAQRRSGDDLVRGRAALDRLQAIRAEVPVQVRRETARAFSGRAIPAPLVAFLSADVPVVAGAILSHVRLDEGDWLTILPRLSPTGRGFLRHRRDLGGKVDSALAGFGASDMALGSEVAAAIVTMAEIREEAAAPVEVELPAVEAPVIESLTEAGLIAEPRLPEGDEAAVAEELVSSPDETPATPFEPENGEGQIRAIISRIARFRDAPRGEASPEPAATSFRFETSADGIIHWVEGVPRGPLVGETIAVPAEGEHGVDGQAPGAFRKRAPFRDARLSVAGQSAASGEWRIAGVPVFSPIDGSFIGYRGTGRRPLGGDRVEPPASASQAGPDLGEIGLQADSLRQLVHELRTPLNAIGGFAEMIRRQMRGPVSTAYRERAQRIIDQAGQLLAAVDDLDVAARLETQRLDLQRVEVDLAGVTSLVCANHEEIARRRGAIIDSEAAPAPLPVMGDPASMKRMVSRLVASCAALAGEGETIRAAVAPAGADVTLTVTRPGRLAGLDEPALLDPAHGPEGDWPDAPLLGLGFSLHLVRRLAVAAGGRLAIEADRFALHLPAATDAARTAAPGA